MDDELTDDGTGRTPSPQEKRRFKRAKLPADFGDECDVCGDPFDVGNSGILMADDETRQVETFAWVRICTGPVPNDYFDTDGMAPHLFMFVHKETDISEGDGEVTSEGLADSDTGAED